MCYITPISIHYVCIGRLIQALQLDMYYFAPKSLAADRKRSQRSSPYRLQIRPPEVLAVIV